MSYPGTDDGMMNLDQNKSNFGGPRNIIKRNHILSNGGTSGISH